MKIQYQFKGKVFDGVIKRDFRGKLIVECKTVDVLGPESDWPRSTYDTSEIRQYGTTLKASFGHTNGKWSGITLLGIHHKDEIKI